MRTIGRIEEVSLIDLGFNNLDSKIDSGASTSALHAQNIRRIKEGDKSFVVFRLLDKSHPSYEDNDIKLPLYKIKRVKSSNGFTQKRYSIQTRMKLGKKIYRIEFTLTDRKDMKYPILLGTKFLKKKFLIDVSKKYLLSSQ
ncbi:MAG: RimK/LysX family protein [Candidatus Kapaibacterium sp.]|nr:ATP-dependent zinc protease [Ignavibacteriota bacterium]MCB9221642.1 ATP-dependent zinc protease [Ignavibacteria bacterium]